MVTKDVPDFTIVTGVPARPMRKRFDDATCAWLKRIAWWNWTEDEVRERLHLLGDLQALRQAFP